MGFRGRGLLRGLFKGLNTSYENMAGAVQVKVPT